MVKHLVCVVLSLFLSSGCAEVLSEEPPDTIPAAAVDGGAADMTAGGDSKETGEEGADKVPEEADAMTEFRNKRQKEMQEMMIQKMMRGGTQTNRPVNIGPP